MMDHVECTSEYFVVWPELRLQRQILDAVVPVLKIALPAIEFLKGNLLSSAILGFFTATYLVTGDTQRWEEKWGVWRVDRVVKSILPNLVYAPEVVRSQVLPDILAGAHPEREPYRALARTTEMTKEHEEATEDITPSSVRERLEEARRNSGSGTLVQGGDRKSWDVLRQDGPTAAMKHAVQNFVQGSLIW